MTTVRVHPIGSYADAGDVQYPPGADATGTATVALLYTATADKTIANTAVETTLFGSGVGSLTLPADYLSAGKSVHVRMAGYVDDTGSPTMRVKLKLGSSVIADTGAATISALLQRSFRVEGILTCRTAGATGTVIGQVWFDSSSGADGAWSQETATVTIDTTTTKVLDVTLTWGTASASNTCTITNAVVKGMG